MADMRVKGRGFDLGEMHRAKTECGRGHPLAGDNVRVVQRDGWEERVCRTCQREYMRESRARRRQSSEVMHAAV